MEDEAGGDEKVLAVPVTRVSPYYKDVANYTDLPPIVVEQIEHFFTHYKDLEPEKWTRVGRWGGRDEALKVITDGLARAMDVTFQSADASLAEGRAIKA